MTSKICPFELNVSTGISSIGVSPEIAQVRAHTDDFIAAARQSDGVEALRGRELNPGLPRDRRKY